MLSKLREMEERKYGKVTVENLPDLAKIDQIFITIKEKYGLAQEDLIKLIKDRAKYLSIPISIFSGELAPLESLALYLYENEGLSQSEIARQLVRDHTTIWTTIMNAKQKRIKISIDQRITVPIHVFKSEKLSILEAVSIYLFLERSLSYHEIALLLCKDDRTIWTVIHRAKKKLDTK